MDAWASDVDTTTVGLLNSILPSFSEFCHTHLHKPPAEMLAVLCDLWLPLSIKLATHRQALGRPLIQGILGGQGTGKTTMCQVLSLILQQLGYRTLSLSLDDLYKSYSDRLILTQQDPRLIWRGPPGTHDLDLGLKVLEQIRQGESPVRVPRFDKSLCRFPCVNPVYSCFLNLENCWFDLCLRCHQTLRDSGARSP